MWELHQRLGLPAQAHAFRYRQLDGCVMLQQDFMQQPGACDAAQRRHGRARPGLEPRRHHLIPFLRTYRPNQGGRATHKKG